MDDEPDSQQATIAIVSGSDGPQFDRAHLDLPVGATTVWVNHTETPRVIVPDREGTRRVMRLAPAGQEGAVWMMQLRSSQQPMTMSGIFGWHLQAANRSAHITIATTVPPAGKTDQGAGGKR
jgi:hypothetical protein